MYTRRKASISEQRPGPGSPLTWQPWAWGSKELGRAGTLKSPPVKPSSAWICPALSRSLPEKPLGMHMDTSMSRLGEEGTQGDICGENLLPDMFIFATDAHCGKQPFIHSRNFY